MSKLLSRIFLVIGILLLTAALVIGTVTLYLKRLNDAEKILKELSLLIPEPYDGYITEDADIQMPVTECLGRDYIGIIELPEYSRRLPVCSDWSRNTVNHIPCRFTGSMYDSSLVIGASDEKGSIDFTRELSLGDRVSFTDVSGACFDMRISEIELSKDADREALCDGEYDMTVFVRNSLSFDYTIVRCTLQ